MNKITVAIKAKIFMRERSASPAYLEQVSINMPAADYAYFNF